VRSDAAKLPNLPTQTTLEAEIDSGLDEAELEEATHEK